MSENTIECSCKSDDATIHATNCSAYEAPENLECTCVEKCNHDTLNVWCDVCGVHGLDACEGQGATVNYETTVTYTAINGTSGVGNDENCNKLFDGMYTQNDFTKWCAKFKDSAYVIFKASEPVMVNGYSFVTGNDNEDYIGRNPKTWTLYGCNNPEANESSGDWEVVHSVENDIVLKDKNYTKYSFEVDIQTTKYQYFMLRVTAVQSGDILQLGELIMDGTTCEHSSSGEGVVTSPTCTEKGYTTYKCIKCGFDYRTDFQSATGHDFGEDDLCTVCRSDKSVGSFILDNAEIDEYVYGDGVLRIVKDGAQLTIANKNPNEATTDKIVIAKDVSATITLAGVNIDVSGIYNACAFKIEDNSTKNVTITLADDTENILKSGRYCAGLQKNGTGDEIGILTIQGGEEGTGSLTATGGSYGAGIGGGYNGAGSGIIISGGMITATGGSYGSGIGGGEYGAGSGITINGGSVKAVAGVDGNDIGGGGDKEAVFPTDDSNNPVYLMEISNSEKASSITINNKEYPVQHFSEAKIYAYLSAKTAAEPNVVKVGTDTTKYCYDNTNSKWLEVVDIPEADKEIFACNGKEQTYTLAQSEYYTISDNVTQSDAGTYKITVTLKDTENTVWSDDTTKDKEYTFTIGYVDENSDGICDGGACGVYSSATQITEDYCAKNGMDNSYIGYYAISNVGNLLWFAEQINAGNTTFNAVLTDHIVVNPGDVSGCNGTKADGWINWTPIGSETNKYNGTFDGNNKTISGLYFNDTSQDYVGLFGWLESGKIKNVGIVNSYLNGHNYVGGICGNNNGTMENCYNTSTVSGTGDVGGICGNNTSGGTITNCYDANTNSSICGASNGTITNCYCLADEETDSHEGTTYKTAKSFASGEVAYLLNGSTSEGTLVWGQDLTNGEKDTKTDAYPVFKTDDNTVYYGYANCQGLTTGKTYSNKKITNKIPDHVWKYEVDKNNRNKMAFNCITDGCTNGGTVTITTPANATYDKVAQEATVTVETAENEKLIETPQVTYTSQTEGVKLVDGKPVNAGTYQASITLGGVTAYQEFEIAKATPDIGTVSGNSLENTLDTSAVVLSRTDKTISGTLLLKEGTELAYGTNAYTYVFKSGDTNYCDTEGTVSITIADTISPTATYQIGTNGFKEFMNAITFGFFFKDTQKVEIQYTDDTMDANGDITVKGSGVQTKQYYISSVVVAKDAIASIEWKDYTKPISLDENGKYFVYTKVVDNAGNTVVLNSDGIVIYEESVITTESANYTYKTNKNITFEMEAKGNTFATLKDGEDNEVNAEYYTVTDNSKITFKAAYLDTLKVASKPYTYKIYMNPQGVETSVPKSSKPELSYEITVNVLVKELTVTGATATGRIYEKENTSVAITEVSLSGVADTDVVSVNTINLTGTLSDANAGDHKEVTLPKLELTGADKENYVLTQPTNAVPTAVTIRPQATGTAQNVTKKYLYLQEMADTVDLVSLLPKDCGTIVNYDIAEVSGDVIYKVAPSVTEGKLTYTVAQDTEEAIGKEGTITIHVQTQNYTSVPITITVEVVDQIPINPQTDVVLKDNSQKLTYGQKLSMLELAETVFKGTDGETVTGTLQWKNGDSIPTVDTKKATWAWKDTTILPKAGDTTYVAVFTPDDSVNYKAKEADITVSVAKATPYIKSAITAEAITYGATLKDSALSGGVVQYSETDDTVIAGAWSWKETATKPVVADSNVTQFDVVFTPTDADNYNAVETKITLTVNKSEKTPNMPGSTMSVLFSQKTVGTVKLPEGWGWSEVDAAKELTVGKAVEATTIYNGEDKGNYVTESFKISINREACTHPEGKQEVKDIVETTCGAEGYTGDTYCKECGTKTATGATIPKTDNHSGGTTNCKTKAICKVCGVFYGELSAVHSWDAGVVTKEATATDKGEKTYRCIVCKTIKKDDIPALGTPVVGEEITSEDGSATYKVTEAGQNDNSVTYEAPTDKNATTVVVPATVTIDNITYKVTTISDTAFAGNKKLTSVTMGDNVTGFSAKTFKGCTNLKTLNTGNGVTSIPANAFKNFKKLTTVKMGTGVKTIGKNAFYGCKKLKTVTIGKSVTKIGAKAFYGCSKIKTLTIKSSKLTTKKIGKKAFTKTSKSLTVKVPKKKFKVYKSMLIKRGVNKNAKFKKN